MTTFFKSMLLGTAILLSTNIAAQNPIIQTRYTSDPAAVVVGDTVYLFTSHDNGVREGFDMTEWMLYKSADMVNWTDCGAIASLKNFGPWANTADNGAWAAQAIQRDNRWYMYCPIQMRGIGMLTATSPRGPWTDPLKKALINQDIRDIDPTVFIDDDGQAYLYWGNNGLWYAKLKKTMTAIDGAITEVKLTKEAFGGYKETYTDTEGKEQTRIVGDDCFEEAPWIYKRNGKYYLIYAAGGVPEHLSYSMSDSPTGPWTYKGKIMGTPEGSFTTHPAVIDFKGHSYLFYHSGQLKGGGGFTRSVCVEEFQYNADGTISNIKMSKLGILNPVSHLSALRRQEAETMAFGSGVTTMKGNARGVVVNSIDDGDYIRVRSVDFGSFGAVAMTVCVKSSQGGAGVIDVCIDDVNSVVASISVNNVSKWTELTAHLSHTVTGLHDVFFRFRAVDASKKNDLMLMDYWQFEDQASLVQKQTAGQLPSLHVDGRQLKDTHGNTVVLHGVMDTPNPYFNSGRWGAALNVTKCLNYFEQLFTAITDHDQGAYCNVFRLHLDPCWTNDTSKPVTGTATGEANISQFSLARLQRYMKSLFWPLMQKAMAHGLYVVVRPPGVCPGTIQVGDEYNQYLMTVWNEFTLNDSIKKYAGQISIELANEPVAVNGADGQPSGTALHDFFQPIVDQCRKNGFTGIIWAPGTGWQSNYQSYAAHPIEGYNIGYAVHDYTGWYGCSDASCDPEAYIKEFGRSVPVVETAPIIITEVDWSPEKEGEGHYNEHGDWVPANYGTWSTGSTSKWGTAYKALLDHYGNISMTLSGTDCYIDMPRYLADGTVTPAFDGLEEACGKACFDWYAEYFRKDYPHADYQNLNISDNGNGTFTNPVIRADYPDPDVVRLGDTFYFVSTTMHHFPGATVLKSKDLVNWEYCAQPLERLSQSDKYNLTGGKDAYSQGMWAAAMAAHNGRLYILINGNDAGGFILSTDNPEGEWQMKKLDRIYYDPGMLFDNGKVYVVSGINTIIMNELDEEFNFKRSQVVVEREAAGLEGSHLYKIGDYYYIYSTYGGWPTGQTIFRSKSIWGPYEEKLLVEKTINGKANTVHQGALVDTPIGEWWTMLMEDLGPLGRLPNLQPVVWQDGWPVVGDNGVPVQTFRKPDVGTSYPREALPTNDNFRSYPLGMQWQWNHNPDNGAWSLFERPGWLRLKANNSADDLMHARNTLTQRIFADSNKPTNGTVCMDISQMKEGDVAGIAIIQDPYAAIAVTLKDGQYKLVWQQDTLRSVANFKPATRNVALDEQPQRLYFRAQMSYATGKCRFYYSYDNLTWKAVGHETQLSYNLSIFVGARFGIFCYHDAAAATNEDTGYVDVDWFSTEDSFDESIYFPEDYSGYNADMLTAVSISTPDELELMIGNGQLIDLTATFADGHTENIAASAKITSNSECVTVASGIAIGHDEGTATLTATYTDPMGNILTTQFPVRSTYFPFSASEITMNLFGDTNKYDETTHTFTPSQYGQLGWVYGSGADMSKYKYLVVKLKKKQNCGANLNIFPENSIWGDCYTTSIGTRTQVVVKLQSVKLTGGANKGKPLDPSHIYIVSLWGNGGGSIVVDNMYLTNNDDYSPNTTAIDDTVAEESVAGPEQVFDLQGRHVDSAQTRRGLYIVKSASGHTAIKKFFK